MTEGKQDVIMENIWKKDSGNAKIKVAEIWHKMFNLSQAEIEKRLSQIVFVIRSSSGEIMGVSTAEKVFVKQFRNYFYGVRFMILPQFRVPGLMSVLVMRTRDFLESFSMEEREQHPIGLIALIENEQMKKTLRAPVLASGFVYLGNSAAGHHIRVYYFKDSRITLL